VGRTDERLDECFCAKERSEISRMKDKSAILRMSAYSPLYDCVQCLPDRQANSLSLNRL
jgi:hypothetical protein